MSVSGTVTRKSFNFKFIANIDVVIGYFMSSLVMLISEDVSVAETFA